MKTITTIFGILLLLSCSENKSPDNSMTNDTNLTSNFQEYFQNLDTLDSYYAAGCISGFYKMLNDQYVIRIVPNLNFEYDDFKKYQIDSNSIDITIELIEFKKGEANLTNVCTDIHFLNVAEPVKKYVNCTGMVVVGKSDPTDFYGSLLPKISIHLDTLTFYDSLGTEKLIISNELLWKVQHQGTPG